MSHVPDFHLRLDQLYTKAFREYWDLDLFSDFDGDTFTFGDAAKQIESIRQMLTQAGIQPGDHIALYARNSSHWAITFFAIMAHGGVIVPILPDFSVENVRNILEHSEAKVLFAEDSLYRELEPEPFKNIRFSVSVDDFNILDSAPDFNKNVAIEPAENLDKQNFSFPERDGEDLLILSYTSGSTGFSKGVMIPVRSIESNIRYARENMPLKAGNRIVSFLPMAHLFGLAFEILFPVSLGCHITIVTKVPSPQILLSALGSVKPHLILMVPLVIEKVYKKRIVPSLKKPATKALLAIPGIRGLIFKKTRDKIVDSFGGNFHEVVIGGAALSPEAEAFFRKIDFPFTVGYGMTECGPLISYAPSHATKKGSSGKLVDQMEIRIDSKNPYRKVGEIQVKGPNVMLGYYKNEKATAAAFTKDGWLRTGDLGIIDKENFIFIKGRDKNMLLGPSGQNIYPEALEARLTNFPFVQECVIVQRENSLTGLVHPDKEALKENNISNDELKDLMEKTRRDFNEAVASYEKLAHIEVTEEEFEKTPKKNIRRFLYD